MSKKQLLLNFICLSVLSVLSVSIFEPVASAEAPPSEASLSDRESAAPGTMQEETTGLLDLDQALSLALSRNPELKAFSLEVRAMEARAWQAGLFPNPEVEIEAENFGGEGVFQDFDSAETTVQLSQVIELARKRAKRKQVASLESGLSGWDYQAKRADVVAQVTKAFVEALAAQKRLALKEEEVLLAEQVFHAVSAAVKVGKVASLEEKRARVVHSISLMGLARAQRSLAGSRTKLAATWGSRTASFDELAGDLDLIRPIPSVEGLAQQVFRNPDIARWTTEMEYREAAVKFEKAKRVPDVTVKAGTRHIRETEDDAWVMGLSVPLPLFDRNQGGLLEARERLAKGEEERRVSELSLWNALTETFQVLSTAYAEATALAEEILPGAESAFEATREGYRRGKFDYLVMLDAQRTLFEVRDQYISALASYHQGVAEVERLIGGRLAEMKNGME